LEDFLVLFLLPLPFLLGAFEFFLETFPFFVPLFLDCELVFLPLDFLELSSDDFLPPLPFLLLLLPMLSAHTERLHSDVHRTTRLPL
jgi:hypothetical protein